MAYCRVEVRRSLFDFTLVRVCGCCLARAVVLPEPVSYQAVLVTDNSVDEGERVGGAQTASEVVLHAPPAGGEVGADLGTVCVEELGEADYFPKSAPWILASVAA